ncbi:hypothetical protein E4U31_005525 [Claviceps sp. LM219 group G6]|nr:hypothetical protein E4U31_005525 [Claviceps sp. LM219 group G6]
MSHDITQQSGEGSMDGRPWSSAELFTFIGFLNEERNDGALQNTTKKFELCRLNAQESERDDRRTFKDILEASGTEWNDEARSFKLSEAQREAFIHKHGARANRIIDNGLPINERLGITIDTHANIFSDGPDAGRNIFENDDICSLDIADLKMTIFTPST